MENFFIDHWLGMLLTGLLGLFLGWLFFRGRTEGDLNMEGEARLRAEADELRAKLRAREGDLATRNTEVTDLKGKLAAAAAGAGAAAIAVKTVDTDDAAPSAAKDDEEAFALEWRNRYLAARVKYLEGRLSEAGTAGAGAAVAATAGAATLAAKRKPAAKKPVAKKPAAKKAPAKAKAKARPAPKVLYTDGPTDGAPDDLKVIKGIGPKFERDLNNKGIYYYRQIGNWKAADVTMVEGVIESIPGRIKRDEWVPQAKRLAKSSGTATKATATKAATTSRKKPGPKPGTKRGALNADGTPRRKPGPKPKTKAAVDPMDRHLEKVRVYEGSAKRDVVANIVKYCGVALRNRDTSLVACSDMKERETIQKGFARKKLGLNKEEADALIARTCLTMKGTRQKSRVTFYYLMARDAGKLDVFGG